MNEGSTTINCVASKIEFNQVCQFLERLQKVKGSSLKKEELSKFFNKWRNLLKKENQIEKENLFPVLRLIIPQSDNERPSYGIKEFTMARMYIELMGLSSTSSDAKSVLEYRQRKYSSGDFAEVLYKNVLLRRCISKGSLRVAEINYYLDQLADLNNANKRDEMKRVLSELTKKMSAVEQKWLIRILLKDMKLKVGHKIILRAFHPDAEDLFNVTTSLKQVCERLKDVATRVSESSIKILCPFRPMLAQNAKLEQVESLMRNERFQLGIKYDGERSQLHKVDGNYKYFSRSGKEYSHVFGATQVHGGTLTRFIHECFDSTVRSCILDGEMMGYNPILKVFMQKGGPFDIKHVTENSDLQPCFVAYDVLHVNGVDLTSLPLSERFRKLTDLMQPKEGHFMIAETTEATTNQEVVDYLNVAIDRREEGIMAKDLSSSYCPNKRENGGWLKIKPEYQNQVVDDLDLVIIGAKFGKGKHANLLSLFYLGLGCEKNIYGEPQKFKSFCRVGSGYTNKELLQITEKLKSKLKVFKKSNVPSWLEVAKEKPDVIVHPRDSLVVQVRASEILASSSYAARFTLRFPRIVKFREDKNYKDACDVELLHRLQSISKGKLACRHAVLSTQEPVPKKRRKTQNQERPQVSLRFRGVDTSTVEIKSHDFKNREICILTGTLERSKQQLQQDVIERGGKVTQNPGSSTFCAVAGDIRNIRVVNCIKSGRNDVVKIDWLVRSVARDQLLPWKPCDMLYTTEETQLLFDDLYDENGDSYDEELNVDRLKEIFGEMKSEVTLSYDSKLEVAEKHDLLHLPVYLFRGLVFFISSPPGPEEDPIVCKALIELHGGLVADALQDASHVITFKQDVLKEKNLRKSSTRIFHMVNMNWVRQCIFNCQLPTE